LHRHGKPFRIKIPFFPVNPATAACKVRWKSAQIPAQQAGTQGLPDLPARAGYSSCHKYSFFNVKKLLERLDQAKIDVIDNPRKTRKLPISERYSDKRSTALPHFLLNSLKMFQLPVRAFLSSRMPSKA